MSENSDNTITDNTITDGGITDNTITYGGDGGDGGKTEELSSEFKAMLDEWKSVTDDPKNEFHDMSKKYNHNPKEVLKAFKELRAQVSERGFGKPKEKPDPEDAEAIAQWRSEMGVPETPEDYKLPDGLSIGEEDKPIIDDFLKIMHENDVPDGVPEKAVEWYYQALEKQAETENAEVAEQRKKSEETLRERYGRDYTAKTNMINNFLKDNFGEMFAEAVMDVPETVLAFDNIITQLNPDINVASSTGGSATTLVEKINKHKIDNEFGTERWFNNHKAQVELQDMLKSALKLGISIDEFI